MNQDTIKTHKELESHAELMLPSDFTGDDFTRMKLAINNLVWMYGKKELTLEQAEIIACDILSKLLNSESQGDE